MSIRRSLSLIAGIVLALAGLVSSLAQPGVAARPARAAALTVCPAGSPLCDYASVQAAVDAAGTGDTIKVAAGTYTDLHSRPAPPWYGGTGPITQVVYLDKSITIRGGYTTTNGFADPPDPAANPTILNALGHGRVLFVAAEISPTVEGLQVTGGNAAGLGGGPYGPYETDAGGGIYVGTTAIFSNNLIVSNTAPIYGGGLYLRSHGRVSLYRNTVVSNTAVEGGGALFYEGMVTLHGDHISGNNADSCGGLDARFGTTVLIGVNVSENQNSGVCLIGGTATVRDSTFAGNLTSGAGGGLYLYGSDADLSGNTIVNNAARRGGGLEIMYDYSRVSLSGNIVLSNTAVDGAGVYLDLNPKADGSPADEGRYSEYVSDAILDHNTISGNTASGSGGGLYLDADFEAAQGQGGDPAGRGDAPLLFPRHITLTHNMVASNTAAAGGGLYLYGDDSDIRLDSNMVMSNTAVDGGGLYTRWNDADLTNNVIANNDVSGHGAGLYAADCAPRLRHTTMVRNNPSALATGLGGDGSGIYLADLRAWDGPSRIALTNTILVSHTIAITLGENTSAGVDGVLWFGNGANVSGTGAITVSQPITANPGFAADGYHLAAGSPAIDAGIYSGTNRDLDDQFRPLRWGYDLGADEYPGVGLAIVKAVQWPAPVPPNLGQAFTYTIAITATGDGDVSGLVVTDTLPVEQRALAAEASAGLCAIQGDWGGRVVCAPGGIAAGAAVYLTLTAEFSTTAQPGQEVINTVLARSDETINSAQTRTYAQDCHVRLNESPVEYFYIQEAVDAAVPGDLVKVAGTCLGALEYGGTWQQVYIGKSLTLRGGYAADFAHWDPAIYPTTLDARQLGRVLVAAGAISTTIEDLRITGGRVVEESGYGDVGGGLHITAATVTLRDNLVFSNTSGIQGGGLYIYGSAATLAGNRIVSNTSAYGGGLYVSGSTIALDHNTINSNTAKFCAGLEIQTPSAVLNSNTISGNSSRGVCLNYGRSTLRDNLISGNSGGGVSINNGTVTLTGNTIANNTTDWTGGAGIGTYSGVITLTGNIVSGNRTSGGGGGARIDYSTAAFVGNTVISNTAGFGGGIYLYGGRPILRDNVLAGNVASGSGGGLYQESSNLVLDGDAITGNTARQGGGLYQYGGSLTAAGTRVVGNTATERGGGLYLLADATLTNMLIADNQAGIAGSGLYVDPKSSLSMVHNTIAHNQGGDGSGLWVSGTEAWSTVALTNTILVSHTIGITVSSGSTVTLDATLWGNQTDWAGQGTIMTGTHNYWGDPAFVDPSAGDYHIGPGSAALDQGVANALRSDIDHQPRPYLLPDLGADEYWPPGVLRYFYLPLLLHGCGGKR